MTEKKVVILGGGPGAVYAYYGCRDAGIPHERVQILVDRFNIVAGAFWLKESPIPWRNVNPSILMLGEPDVYSQKQWGKMVQTSAHRMFQWNRREVVEVGYNPYTLLPTLWGIMPYIRLYGRLQEHEIQQLKADSLAVIQTFPQRVGTDPTVKIPVYTAPIHGNDFCCIYNGVEGSPWVRQTLTPGKVFVEYPRDSYEKFSMSDLHNAENERWGTVGDFSLVPDLPPEVEPLSLEERIQGNLFLVGRFAHRDRAFLSHQTRHEVFRFLESLNSGDKRDGEASTDLGGRVAAAATVQSTGKGDPETVPG